jgi:hypothetical protein
VIVEDWDEMLPDSSPLPERYRFEPSFSTTVSRGHGREELPPVAGPGEAYRLDAVGRNGKRYQVVSDLKTLEQCAWVERELRRALGMWRP